MSKNIVGKFNSEWNGPISKASHTEELCDRNQHLDEDEIKELLKNADVYEMLSDSDSDHSDTLFVKPRIGTTIVKFAAIIGGLHADECDETDSGYIRLWWD